MERVKDRIGIGEKEAADGTDAPEATPRPEPDLAGGGVANGAPGSPAPVPAGGGAANGPDGSPAPVPAGTAWTPTVPATAAVAESTATPGSAAGPAAAPEATGPWLSAPAPPPPVTVPPQPDRPEAAPAAAAPAAPGLSPAVPAGPAPPTPAAPAAAAPAFAPTTPAGSPAEPPPVRPVPAPPPGAPNRTGNAQATQPVPPATGAVAPVQPEAVKPTAVRSRPTPRARIAPTREINPGDLVCSQCGEGNDPDRKFCRRCGASLQMAVIYTLPWYTRWWRRLTARKTLQAGDRPRVRRRAFGGSAPGWLTSWVTRVIVLVIALFVILNFVGPWRHSLRHRVSRYYHDVVNVVHPTYNPVHPDSAAATSFTRGHPAAFAIDDAQNTSWWTGGRGTGQGQRLLIRLGTTTNVDKIGFLLGDQDSAAAFVTQGRPASVRLNFNGPHPYAKTLTLKDSPSFQSYTISAKDASEMLITIESVQPTPPGTHAAIAEVELFKKS